MNPGDAQAPDPRVEGTSSGRIPSGDARSGCWPYRPTAVWRKLVALIGLGAFTAVCAIALVALVLAGAVVGALVLEAVIG